MKGYFAKLALTAVATLLSVSFTVALSQTTHDVHMLAEEVEGEFFPEYFFEPTGLYIEPGDTVRFVADAPRYTVTAIHEANGYPVTRIPDGVTPFSSPVVPLGESWEYTFEEEGVYDLVSVAHDVYGMVMRIVVGEVSGPAAQPLPEEIANRPGGPSVLSASALDPEAIVEAGSVSWSESGSESRELPFFMQDVEPPQPPAEEE